MAALSEKESFRNRDFIDLWFQVSRSGGFLERSEGPSLE